MKLPLIFAAVVATSVSAKAATLLSFDFESNNFAYYYGYIYQEFGSGTVNNNGNNPTAGAGQGGTAGARTTFNMTNVSGGYAGLGMGFGGNPANATRIAGAASLADFAFTIGLRADGLTGSSVGVGLELKFEVPDNYFLPADGNTDADTLLVLSLNRTLTTTYQTFTTTLADWTITSGSLAQLKSNLGALNNINMNIGYGSGGNVPEFGNDANNVLAADNYTLSVVPEAGTAPLGLLSIVSLRARRRR